VGLLGHRRGWGLGPPAGPFPGLVGWEGLSPLFLLKRFLLLFFLFVYKTISNSFYIVK
jgi:hypothetical protein